MIGDNILKKIEYQEFNKIIKISSISLSLMILFIYFSQFFEINIFLIFIDVVISVVFLSSVFVTIIKSLHLIKIIDLEVKDNYVHKKPRKLTVICSLLLIFIIGVALMFVQTNYRVSANVLSVFFLSIPILSFYVLYEKESK